MKEKLFLLLQTTDGGADIRVGSINIYYGIRKKKDAEKHNVIFIFKDFGFSLSSCILL